MQVLIVGGGGREHALAWACARSDRVARVSVAPGNAGTAAEPKVRNISIAADNIAELLRFAQAEAVDLTIVGPETPLVNGIVDRFSEAGLACFGPTQNAAQLEGSKTFTKDFLARHKIPTAESASFTEVNPALDYIRSKGAPIVVKADGLAAGKGVVVAMDIATAETAVRDMLVDESMGAAGNMIVVEEYLRGEEASFIVVTDGTHCVPLATSQDHKARDDGDRGPNTGGMGAYSPAAVVTPELSDRIMAEVIEPTVRGLRAENILYKGFLYAGIMIAPDGTPNVLEYNCRFGDPETQPILARLKSDLAEICTMALAGRLGELTITWDPRAAVGVVMAADGYPGQYAKGEHISGFRAAESGGAKVFHAGTRNDGYGVVSDGGRVLCVVGMGTGVTEAQSCAYRAVAQIDWPGAYYRRDIAYRAIEREQA